MEQIKNHKRGDTWKGQSSMTCTVNEVAQSLSRVVFTVRKSRDSSSELVGQLDSDAAEITISGTTATIPAQVIDWVAGHHYCEIRFTTTASEVYTTPLFRWLITDDLTA